jgi:hypothetical protein
VAEYTQPKYLLRERQSRFSERPSQTSWNCRRAPLRVAGGEFVVTKAASHRLMPPIARSETAAGAAKRTRASLRQGKVRKLTSKVHHLFVAQTTGSARASWFFYRLGSKANGTILISRAACL